MAGARRRRPRAAAPGDRRPLRRVPALPGEPGRAAAAHARPRRARTWPRCATRRSTCWAAAPLRGPAAGRTDGFAFGMIVQHEQQHDETMLATHQLRAGAPVLHAPPPPPGRAAARGAPRCWSRRGRSRWARPPSRGRWTTSGPRTSSTCPRSGSTPRRSRTGSTRRSSTRAATTTRAGGRERGLARTASRPGCVAPAFWARDARRHVVAAALRRASSRCRPTEPVVHVCCHEAEAYAAWAGSAAAHRGRVGEGGAATTRPPAGRGASRGATTTRRPRTPTSGSATCSPAPVGRLPGGRVAAGRAPADRRRVGVDRPRAGTPTRGSRRSRTRSTPQVFFGGDYRVLRGGSFGTDPAAVRAHVPQLGPPDPPADLRRVPLRPRPADPAVEPEGG